MESTNYPIIEIHGTGVHNRGAELMAIAISEKLRAVYPDVQIVVPSIFGTQPDIQKHNFVTTLSFESHRKKHLFSLFNAILSGKTINPANVDVVLDASGFAFSDQWGDKPARKLALKMNKNSRKNQMLILLPQALGAFAEPNVKSAVQNLFSRANIVFARDDQSYEHAKALISEPKKLQQSPDFTIGVTPLKSDTLELPTSFVGIVPNYRMLDKSGSSEEYLMFLRKSVEFIKKNGLNPVFIIHDGNEDFKVVALLGDEYKDLTVIQHSDPRVLKWVLGQADFVIGSRFHALVSTMSQGVPAIGAGWSHKYEELFIDFSNRNGLIDNLSDIHSLEKQISLLSVASSRAEVAHNVQKSAIELKSKVNNMWDIVISNINKHLNRS